METNRKLSSILDIGVPLFSLLGAYLLDSIEQSIQSNSAETFERFPLVQFKLAEPIIGSLLFLALVWYLFRKSAAPRRAAAAYMIFGAIGILMYASIMFRIPVLDAAFLKQLRAVLSQFAFGSIYWISYFLFVTGIAGIFRKR